MHRYRANFLRKLAKITSFTSLMDLRIDTAISRIGEIDVPVVAAGRSSPRRSSQKFYETAALLRAKLAPRFHSRSNREEGNGSSRRIGRWSFPRVVRSSPEVARCRRIFTHRLSAWTSHRGAAALKSRRKYVEIG
jgi:hypothetical protein